MWPRAGSAQVKPADPLHRTWALSVFLLGGPERRSLATNPKPTLSPSRGCLADSALKVSAGRLAFMHKRAHLNTKKCSVGQYRKAKKGRGGPLVPYFWYFFGPVKKSTINV